MYQTDECRLRECLRCAYGSDDITEEQSAQYFREIHTLRNHWVAEWVRRNRAPIERFARRLKAAKVLHGTELQVALSEAWNGEKPECAALSAEVDSHVKALFLASSSDIKNEM